MRLVDYACDECRRIVTDLFDDDPVPLCRHGEMKKVLLSPPSVDAREPFKVLSLGGPAFSSYREMETYAKNYIDPATGEHKPQIVLPKEEQQKRPAPLTMEERLKRNMPEKVEAFRKARYRLKHGYVDHPKLPSEKEIKTS